MAAPPNGQYQRVDPATGRTQSWNEATGAYQNVGERGAAGTQYYTWSDGTQHPTPEVPGQEPTGIDPGAGAGPVTQSGGDFGFSPITNPLAATGAGLLTLPRGVAGAFVEGYGEVSGANAEARANEEAAKKLRALADAQGEAYGGVADASIGELAKSRALGEGFSEELATGPSYQEAIFGQGQGDINRGLKRFEDLADRGEGRLGLEADRLSALGGGPGYTETLAKQRQGGGLDDSARFALEEGNRDIANAMSAAGINRSGATGEASYRLGRGVQADMGRRNEQLFQAADSQKRANALAALTGAGAAEDTVTGRTTAAGNAGFNAAGARGALAGGADTGRERRMQQAFDMLFTPESLAAGIRGDTGMAALRSQTDLATGAIGGDIAATQSRTQRNRDLLNFGAQVLAPRGTPRAPAPQQRKRRYYGDDTMDPTF